MVAAGREIYRFLFGRPKLLPATLVVLASSIHINTSFRKRRLAQQQPAAAAVAWYQIISSYSIQDLVIKEDMIWFHTI